MEGEEGGGRKEGGGMEGGRDLGGEPAQCCPTLLMEETKLDMNFLPSTNFLSSFSGSLVNQWGQLFISIMLKRNDPRDECLRKNRRLSVKHLFRGSTDLTPSFR